MAYIDTAHRVAEVSTTTGTSAMAMTGAVSTYQRFNAIPSIASSDTLPYGIVADDGQWEVGIGTYTTNTITRTTVTASSNSNSICTLTAGTKTVFLGFPGMADTIDRVTAKTPIVAADKVGFWDSVTSKLRYITWTNLLASIKTYTDTLYPSGSGTSSGTNTGDQSVAMTFVSTATASSSATIDFTGFVSGYDYVLMVNNAVPAVTSDTPAVRVTQDAGSTWLTSNYYEQTLVSSGTAVTAASAFANTSIKLSNSAGLIDNTVGYGGFSMNLHFRDPKGTSYKTIDGTGSGYDVATGSRTTHAFSGLITNSTTGVDGIRFFYLGGNIASGVFMLYRIKRSA